MQVGGLTVSPGDLLHADQHGVLSIPADVAARLAAMVRRYEACEQEFLARVRAPGFGLERLVEDWESFDRARGELNG